MVNDVNCSDLSTKLNLEDIKVEFALKLADINPDCWNDQYAALEGILNQEYSREFTEKEILMDKKRKISMLIQTFSFMK